MRTRLGLVLLCVLSTASFCSSTSPPGNPRFLGCRSPDKETFSCWWESGPDGGLPTEYRLYYERENMEGVHECPDYVSAGVNSCFFDKSHTSIWAEYNLRVVATNAFGNASTDLLVTDVMKYVKPYPPVNVTVLANSSAPTPYLQVKWQSPPNVDVRTGWVTINYELRFKPNDSKEWKNLETGKESYVNLYSLNPGALYMVQVRCKLDHGSWSEWSNTTYAKIPKYLQTERPFWILVCVFSLIPLLAVISILVLKRKLVKQWLLPPVPGPKIRGVDVQLLKSGRSEDIVNALIGSQSFPPMKLWTEQVEEYLLVSDSNEWLLTDPYILQKKKEGFIIPAGLHFDSKIQNGKSTAGQNACEKVGDEMDQNSSVSLSTGNLSNMDPVVVPVEKQEHQSGEKTGLTKNIEALASTTHVDIQQHDNSLKDGQTDYSRVKEVNGETILILSNVGNPQELDDMDLEVKKEMNAPEDYSRVKEVNSNAVLLQKHDSAESYCKKMEDHYTAWPSQKPAAPSECSPGKGFCPEMIGNGYVDSVLAFSVK